MPHEVIPHEEGEADHAAPRKSPLSSLPFRTALQGLATDVLFAVSLVVYDTAQQSDVDWRLMVASLGKTAVMTAASWVMKKAKPPTSP